MRDEQQQQGDFVFDILICFSGGDMNRVSFDIHLNIYMRVPRMVRGCFFPGVFLHYRVMEACLFCDHGQIGLCEIM